ncbi:SurA N-terminal domain-containing protein [Candidatus Gottesmanbacteria bacterium]|nr:SurA N-terminal domain-containing protein [Candidatus Gottesmanbacteria bacterium]
MPKKKTALTSLKAQKKQIEDLVPMMPPEKKKMPTKWVWVVVIALGLIGVAWMNKGMVVAAVVNGKPVFRWDLNRVMTARYGEQTLEGMISEQLIADAAKSSGVVVSKEDVDTKVADVLKSLGSNVSLDDLLKYQGMTKSDFENQIRLQLTVEKVLGRDLEIADADVDAFIAANRATLVSTDAAALRQEAKNAITSQKVSEKLQPWFMELKDKAKITKFL